jgi:transcriptional regulator, XRE family
MFLERTLELIEKKNISKNKLLTDLKLSKNSFVDWQNRGTIPSAETIEKIADYFGVTTDYLLGRTDDINQKPGESNIKMDDFSYALYNESRELDDDDKQRLLKYARMLRNAIEERNNKSGGEQ